METTLTAPAITAFRSYMGGYFTVLISPEQSGGEAGMARFNLPQGSEPPLHVHMDEDETFYVLAGQVAFFVGDDEVVVNPGEAAFAPRGIPHRFEIRTAEAQVLIMVTPGKFINFFREFSQPVNGQPQICPPQGPPPPEAIQYMAARLSQEYNCFFV